MRRGAKIDVITALLTQGIGLQDLTPEVLLHHAIESSRLGTNLIGEAAVRPGRLAGRAAWDVLHRMGHFPPGAPHSLQACLSSGPRTAAELVDRYDLINHDVRQLIIDYLERRRPECDYSSWASLARRLAGLFWKQVEQINPDLADLNVPRHTYDQWLATLRLRSDGRTRRNPEAVLMCVRGFYRDLQAWATEEPERWAHWAAPCPVPPGAVRHSRAEKRRVTERVADRIRQRQPWLPTLVEHVDAELQNLRAFLAESETVPPGEVFSYRGKSYRRTATAHDRQMIAQGQVVVRVQDVETGELINLTLAEDAAFWTWACVETLRHTGVRIEELLELSQLSIRQYERPNGEVIGLLVIAPSKTDRERVIPMSAELFHVIA